MLITDLLGQIIQVTVSNDPEPVQFGRVRAVYVAEGKLRIAILLRSGLLIDTEAHCVQTKKEGWREAQ